MDDELFINPYAAFLVVATAITILILLLRLFFKRCVLLWKSALISYIVFVVFLLMGVAYENTSLGDTLLYRLAFNAFSVILLAPGLLIYGLIPGFIKPCPSDFDVFSWHTIAFLFYAIVIWGIMKLIKKSKEPKAIAEKQDDTLEKQTPKETEA
jgi:hypothetical protein